MITKLLEDAGVEERIHKGFAILQGNGVSDAMLEDIFKSGLGARRWPAAEQAFKSHSTVAAQKVAEQEPEADRLARIQARLAEATATYTTAEADATARAVARATKQKKE